MATSAIMETALRKHRKESGRTQEWLAQQLSVTKATVSRWETGCRRVPAERIADISRLIGAPPEVLRPDLFAVHEAAE